MTEEVTVKSGQHVEAKADFHYDKKYNDVNVKIGDKIVKDLPSWKSPISKVLPDDFLKEVKKKQRKTGGLIPYAREKDGIRYDIKPMYNCTEGAITRKCGFGLPMVKIRSIDEKEDMFCTIKSKEMKCKVI